RRDEDQQLLVAVVVAPVAEEVAEDGDVGEAGDPVLPLVAGHLVDAADHGGAAVADDHARLRFLGGDGSVGGADDGEGELRLAFLYLDVHQHGAVGGDVRRHLQAQRGVDELHGDGVVGHRLHRDLQTALDVGGGVVERRHLGGGEDV